MPAEKAESDAATAAPAAAAGRSIWETCFMSRTDGKEKKKQQEIKNKLNCLSSQSASLS